MLKIFIFSPFALENGRGGEISSIELAIGLQKYYNITLVDTNICFGENRLSKFEIKNKIKSVHKKNRIKFATLNLLNKTIIFPLPWEILKLYRMIKKANVIYTSISFFKVDILFMFFCLLHPKAKFIIGYRKPLYSKKILSLYNVKYRLSILFFSIFDGNIYHHTLSEHAKNYLENFYDPNKIIYIRHGIDLSNYYIRRIGEKNREVLKFVYVGAFEDSHKGFGVLLKAITQVLKENKNLKIFFEFCGRGPLEAKLKKLESKYPQYIRYYGFVNNEKLPEIYQKNDILLFSSRDEPFGRVIIEALASYLIVLCTITIGSIEILSKKEFAFFIHKLNPQAIKEKIVEIYNLWKNNPLKIGQLQELARNYAFQQFSLSIELDTFKKVIDKINKNTIS